jgi:predicted membrane-bound spermidine synthase
MVGLCGGAIWGELRRAKDDRQAVTDILGYAVAVSFAITLVISALGRWSGVVPVALGFAMFLAVTAVTGFLGGAQFPIAFRLSDDGEASNVPGRLYGFDLFGSALGATVMAAMIVPVLGLAQGALIIAAILAAAMIVMSSTGRRKITNVNER